VAATAADEGGGTKNIEFYFTKRRHTFLKAAAHGDFDDIAVKYSFEGD
jgi:hypothetical protein